MIRSSARIVSSLWGRNAQAALSTEAAAAAPPPPPPDADYSVILRTAHELQSSSLPPKSAGLCAGVPLETFTRKVRIFSPARNGSQSGQGRTTFNTKAPAWRIAFSTAAKWENPLMGWTSTADPLENVGRSLLTSFNTPEEAAAFAQKQGWEYTIDYPNQRRTTRQRRYASYGDNYSTKRKGIPDLSSLPSNRKAPAASA